MEDTKQKLPMPDDIILLLFLAVFAAIGLFVDKARENRLAASQKARFEEWLAHAPKKQIPRLLAEKRSTPRFIDAGLRSMYDMRCRNSCANMNCFVRQSDASCGAWRGG